MLDLDTFVTPYLEHIGPAGEREPQAVSNDDILPPGTELISADDHWDPSEDVFYDRVPSHLKEEAPRVWFDRFLRIQKKVDNVEATPLGMGDQILRVLEHSIDQTGWQRERRIQVMKGEGIKRSVIFPNSMLAWVSHPNFELREWVFRIYNEVVMEEAKYIPGFVPVGVFPNWWDPDKAEESMQQIVDLGFKTFMIPFSVKNIQGQKVNIADPEMDRFWAVTEESGLPMSFHIGESANFEGRGGAASQIVCSFNVFDRNIGEMIFGGVFDRHPKLQIFFAEAGISWVAQFLNMAEFVYDTYGHALNRPKHRPSHYWHNHCYASFQIDRLGLSLLHLIGADRVMWGSDYPHSEGSFGCTREAIKDVLAAATPEQARMILGGTAKKLFKLN